MAMPLPNMDGEESYGGRYSFESPPDPRDNAVTRLRSIKILDGLDDPLPVRGRVSAAVARGLGQLADWSITAAVHVIDGDFIPREGALERAFDKLFRDPANDATRAQQIQNYNTRTVEQPPEGPNA